jgi:outer membrane lipoprotein-sorting protein
MWARRVPFALAVLLALLPVRAVGPDPQAEALLKQCRAGLEKAQTLTAELEIEFSGPPPHTYTGTAILKRPNFARIETRGSVFDAGDLIVSNGAEVTVYTPALNQYRRSSPGADGRSVPSPLAEPLGLFFRPGQLNMAPVGVSVSYGGEEMLDGQTYEVVQFAVDGPDKARVRYFFSRQDRLPHAVLSTGQIGDRPYRKLTRLKNVRIDAPVDTALFRWTPPPGARIYQQRNPTTRLIPVGSRVPDFDRPAPDGGRVNLLRTAREKKAVLINFWSYG